MKNKYNTLKKYLYDNSEKEYNEKTVNGLFRAILEPVISNQKFEACVLLRLLKTEGRESLLKRLMFSGAQVVSFSDNIKEIENSELENIWDTTEFMVVLGQRYTSVLIWDYSTCKNKDYTELCLLYNSKKIAEIVKVIQDNSKKDLKEILLKYSPDRRENSIFNQSIRALADILNDRNNELLFSKAEKENLTGIENEIYKTAQAVSENAKFTAHEIKNNLSVINLYSRIIEKRLENTSLNDETTESVTNAIKNINKASQTMSDLINNLRCLSAPNVTELNIKKTILSSILLCSERAKNKGVEIIADNLDDKVISADKTHIECALTNVIFNATDACSKGCKIVITSQIKEDKVNIRISNNGEKIPDDIQDKIFNLDFTTKENGSGAGLYICKKQLEATGGDIRLVSSDENETVFEITV